MTMRCALGLSDFQPIAAIRYAPGTAVDGLMQEIADHLAAAGVRLGGFVQHATAEDGDCCAVMHLRDLRDGSLIPISQDLGPAARGCRLDPGVLAEVAERLEVSLDSDLQILILNRFGRAEAEGRGLRSAIQKAVAAGIPILMAVKDEYAGAWAEFHGGLGVTLPVNRNAILYWCLRAAQSCGCA